ncbi:MAG TPA: DCC1-like thiol-disulfide oxidoreductase family protein [Tepidisphaeraceae bacterium]|nr:DCC1-like thiol-disulfide oxidoreductase family protein [Tepidisphaeraceae bacterium]
MKRIAMKCDHAIVIFDGECAFCDRSVRWLIDHDRAHRLRFAARQSAVGQRLLGEHRLPPGGVESMILIQGNRVSTHSTAVLRVARLLPLPWKLAAVALIIPRPIRDFFYRAVAKRRYRLAGRLDRCSIPTAAQRARLLDDYEQPAAE